MNKGGTRVGANECLKNNLSRLIVRATTHESMPNGNRELLNTGSYIELKDSSIFDYESFSKLIEQNKME